MHEMRSTRVWILGAALTLAVAVSASAAEPVLHHRLEVRLDPAAGSLRVTDTIAVASLAAAADGSLRFALHAGLAPRVTAPGWRLEADAGPVPGVTPAEVPVEVWRLLPVPGGTTPAEVQLAYGGVIRHPLESSAAEQARGFSATPGLIDPRGVFLAGSSLWLPAFGDQLITFDLEVRGLEPPWDVVSQGSRTRHEKAADGTRVTAWHCPHPSEEAYLVAGPWHEFDGRAGEVALMVLLRSDDAALANRYLEAASRYLTMYEGLIAPFPYASFAVVENFWETGYGMPGFTLLGSQVLRFPWILTSSFPHELLHDWWGNGVFPDQAGGNWSEGLTAYLADHLFAQQRGEGVGYRRATLKRYSDFAREGTEPALADFHERSSPATEAVGYGKALMVFHMLRHALGDKAFVAALRAFWKEHRYRRASWSDLAAAFSAAAGRDLRPFVATWVSRTGAPQLEVAAVLVRRRQDGALPWEVEVDLRQTQPEAPFPVQVPVAVTVAGQPDPVWGELSLDERTGSVVVPCPAKPLRVDVDPACDVMRRLDPREVAPTLSTVAGAPDPLFVLPAAAPATELAAWRELAAKWHAEGGPPRVVLDRDLQAPPTGPAWVLGWANTWAAWVRQQLERRGVATTTDGGVRLGSDTVVPASDHSVVAVARQPDDASAAVAWVAADPPAAIPGLARKLPHYGRYSALVFAGSEPSNTTKLSWEPLASPLTRSLGDGPPPALHLPRREPLASPPPAFAPVELAATVATLASPAMDGRGLGTAGLAAATAWVERRLATSGTAPAGDEGLRQTWTWHGGEPPRDMELVNLVAKIPGGDPQLADHPVLVTAHLDHLGHGWPDVHAGDEGRLHPGADDNASGVAALLALARKLAAEGPHARPILLAATTGEEAGLLGARHLLASLGSGRLPMACINLDTVGRLGDGSVLVLDAASAREWPYLWMGVAATTGVKITTTTEPLDSSDQAACLELGVPAVQLTTGPTPDYHRPTDTPDRIDAAGLAQVTAAAYEAIAYLADRSTPLTFQPAQGGAPAPPAPAAGPRRAALGTVPDFAFAGPGVRVEAVVPGSPAVAAGIHPGDVLTALDGQPVADLRGYSELLKAHEPGDQVTVTVLRDGDTLTLTAVLARR